MQVIRLVSLAVALLLTTAAFADDSQQCRQRLYDQYLASLASCDHVGPPVVVAPIECVPNCVERISSIGFSDHGNCKTFGADFCAPHARCILNCTSRVNSPGFSDHGKCKTYGADICSGS